MDSWGEPDLSQFGGEGSWEAREKDWGGPCVNERVFETWVWVHT